MITERDLEQAIAECQGERNPNANTCIKLAAFYTIRNEMFGKATEEPESSYASAPASSSNEGITYEGESEFAQAIYGRDQREIWPIIDELMSTIQILHSKLYDGVMRKIDG